MSVLVVTGTDTGVGKTVVTAAIASLAKARGASVVVVKPAQTGVLPGETTDMDEVIRLAGITTTFEGARYLEALSPAAAARAAGLPPVSLPDMAARIKELAATNRLVIVEGAGGLLVRFDDEGTTIADLARLLTAQVLVVARAGLGTLNHTALTLESLAHRGLDPAGVVIGSWPQDPGLADRSNIRDLEMLAARPLSGALPEGAGRLDPEAFLTVARDGLAAGLGGVFSPALFRETYS